MNSEPTPGTEGGLLALAASRLGGSETRAPRPEIRSCERGTAIAPPGTPTTGEIKAVEKLDYPNKAGALATAGNLVFLGHYDGTFAAYDAKTLNEVWSFNLGSPIQAP